MEKFKRLKARFKNKMTTHAEQFKIEPDKIYYGFDTTPETKTFHWEKENEHKESD